MKRYRIRGEGFPLDGRRARVRDGFARCSSRAVEDRVKPGAIINPPLQKSWALRLRKVNLANLAFWNRGKEQS